MSQQQKDKNLKNNRIEETSTPKYDVSESFTNYASPDRTVIVNKKDIAERINLIGYGSENKNLITQKIYNNIAKQVYSPSSSEEIQNLLETDLDLTAEIQQEIEALNQESKKKQQNLHTLKLGIAAKLGEMRKKLWHKQIDKNEIDAVITNILDAIEYCDHLLDNYKPEKYIDQESKFINLPSDYEEATHMLSNSYQEKKKESIISILAKFGVIATITYITLSYLTSWLALTLGIPFIFTAILLSTIAILIARINVDNSQKQIQIDKIDSIDSANMEKHYQYHWSFASLPGRLAETINKEPVKACTYGTLTLILILALTSTAFGVGIVNSFAAFTGVNFALSLYALITLGFCVIFGVEKLISNIIQPEENDNHTKETFKPYNINPVARFWQAIDVFLDKFYLLGMQNPISMLVFTVVYIGITVEVMVPFLPAYMHNIVFYFVTGISNPSAGLLFAGLCTGWFIGLFILTVGDIISRKHKSGMLESIKYMKNNAIDALLFSFLLVFSASIVAGTSLAHICGRWVILGLVTINFKPLLAIADFMNSPRKSIIGSSFSLLLMPINIILYPGELIKYVLKKSTQIIFGIIKHFLLHVPLVLIRSLFEIGCHTLSLLGFKNAAKSLYDINMSTYLFVRNIIFKVKYSGKVLFRNVTPASDTLGKACHVCFAIIASVLAYVGLFYIWGGSLPKIATLIWVSAPLNFLTSLISIQAAATIFAVLGAFIMVLCTHQLLCKKSRASDAEEKFTLAQQIIFTLLTIFIASICYLSPPAYPLVVSTMIFCTFLAVITASLACHNNKPSIPKQTIVNTASTSLLESSKKHGTPQKAHAENRQNEIGPANKQEQ